MSVQRGLAIAGCVLCVVLCGLAVVSCQDAGSARCLSQAETCAIYAGDYECNANVLFLPCSDSFNLCAAKTRNECSGTCIYCTGSGEHHKVNTSGPTNVYVDPDDSLLIPDGCGQTTTGPNVCSWTTSCNCTGRLPSGFACPSYYVVTNYCCIPPGS